MDVPSYSFKPVAILRSCYREKFSVPRQAGLVSSARAVIEFYPEAGFENALLGLEGFSHLWVQFVFHLHMGKTKSYKVRPPRLGGEKSLGVFATRSPHRPNPLGLSVVKIEEIHHGREARIEVSGVDMVDGTPILDIKPYVPYADQIQDASCNWAEQPKKSVLQVHFSKEALEGIESFKQQYPGLQACIEQSLALDPRPAFQKRRSEELEAKKDYAFRLYEFDVKFRVQGDECEVLELLKI